MSASVTARTQGNLVPAGRLRAALEERRAKALDVGALAHDLRAAVRGEIRFEAASRGLYAQDASNYRRIPLGVVVPSSTDDVVAAVGVCREHGAPIVARGGGTALAGQTVNEAVVIDFSKRVNRITSLDPQARLATVEPGVICDELVEAAKPYGLTWGPCPSTHDHCCFGGMLANNCGGMRAQMNGIAVHNVEALDVLLYDGTRMRVGWMREEDLSAAIRRGGPGGALLARLRALRDRWGSQIRARYPALPRRVSGYNLDELLPGPDGRFNLARLLVGSEGTLVTMLEATVDLIPSPPCRGAVVLGYRDIYEAGDAAGTFADLRPLGVEGMDELLRDHMASQGTEHSKALSLLPDGKGWLLIEVGGETADEVEERAEEVVRRAGRAVVAQRTVLEHEAQMKLWEAREGGLGATAFVRGQPDAWPGWEDSAVPPERLGSYLRDLRRLYDAYDYHPSLYGHFGMGLVHCRVPFDLYTEDGIRAFRRFMNDAADLVVSYGGSLSGEHGDGQARAELLERMFGADLMEAMRELKAIFDPYDRMNPGKVVRPSTMEDHLRLGPSYQPLRPSTHFHFADDDGSFARAALRCVGVGRCRRKSAEGEHDVMCPSYMVTHEERHATRGRAHLLWEMLRGDGPITGGWKDEGVKSSLDLCLACKGCKSDCPVKVDLATYKAEFLSHYYEGRLRPRHAYAFGYIDKWARLGSAVPGLANLATQLPGVRALAKLAAGISPAAKIPPFAPETFRKQLARRGLRVKSGRRVVLWTDTFNEHFFPDTLLAAVDVLEAASCEVVLPPTGLCCGRPLYDFGLLEDAKSYLHEVLEGVGPLLDEGLPVVVLEPSCASTFKDELVDLLPDHRHARVLRDRTRLLSELLTDEQSAWAPPKLDRRAIVQGHCHQKAVFEPGLDSDKKVLAAMGVDHEVLSSGCCGMAGSFGFAKETHQVGLACGERSLLPKVRGASAETVVIANGFSCREQIRAGTKRGGLHLAEVVKLAMDRDPGGPAGPHPESAVLERRRRGVHASMLRALVGIGLGFAVLALASAARRKRW
ncbi:MAG: FAD-binding oxidoreductase [Labilithrix sp.]|nr:FAD-binding oxidoreductase [Labilithrix sp.]